MKLRTFILTVILMSLFILPIHAEVHLSFEGKDLIAHSDQKGVEGFKGCDANSLEKIPAYTFRLLKREIPSNSVECKAPSGKWKQVGEETSNNGSVMFEDVGDGDYKVVCLVSKAIGCEIDRVPDGYPDRSIVYEQAVSDKITKGSVSGKEKIANSTIVRSKDLLLFPNPTQTEINIKVTSTNLEGAVQLVIYDMMGKEFYSKNDIIEKNNQANWKVETEDYVSGTYLVRVVDEHGMSLEGKFIVVGE